MTMSGVEDLEEVERTRRDYIFDAIVAKAVELDRQVLPLGVLPSGYGKEVREWVDLGILRRRGGSIELLPDRGVLSTASGL